MPEMPRQTHSILLADKSCDAYRQDTVHEVPGMWEVELAEKSPQQGRYKIRIEIDNFQFVEMRR